MARRIAALERAPRLKGPEEMTLGELLEEVAYLVGQRDAAAAQRIRTAEPRDVLACARAETAAVLQERTPHADH